MASAASSSRASWASTSGSRPRSQRGADQAGEAARRVQRGEQQDRVRAGRAQDGQLPRVDHELLGQDRAASSRPAADQVIDASRRTSAARRARRSSSAARLVGAGPIGDVEVAVGERPADGERRLISRDEVEAGAGEAADHVARAGRCGRPRARPCAGRPSRAPRRCPGAPPVGDLLEHRWRPRRACARLESAGRAWAHALTLCSSCCGACAQPLQQLGSSARS